KWWAPERVCGTLFALALATVTKGALHRPMQTHRLHIGIGVLLLLGTACAQQDGTSANTNVAQTAPTQSSAVPSATSRVAAPPPAPSAGRATTAFAQSLPTAAVGGDFATAIFARCPIKYDRRWCRSRTYSNSKLARRPVEWLSRLAWARASSTMRKATS
ncbi:MAG: hypothetical protein ACR2IK_04145, partial [Chloroflexota bacterium]